MSIFEILDAARAGAAGKQPKPQWYPDPTTRHQRRFWDGEQWTPSVSDGADQSDDPLDLTSPVAGWRHQMENARVEALRGETVAARYGITPDEAVAICRGCIWFKPEKVAEHVALLQADPSTLKWSKRGLRDLILRRTAEVREERAAARDAAGGATPEPRHD